MMREFARYDSPSTFPYHTEMSEAGLHHKTVNFRGGVPLKDTSTLEKSPLPHLASLSQAAHAQQIPQ
eukprot:6464724-Amphidinium_carterae.1